MPAPTEFSMSRKAFASQADLEDKPVSFTRLSEHAYAYTAEGDPNTGIIIGDNAVMVIDTQATPVMAQEDRKSTRLNSSHIQKSRMPSSA